MGAMEDDGGLMGGEGRGDAWAFCSCRNPNGWWSLFEIEDGRFIPVIEGALGLGNDRWTLLGADQ